MVIFICLSESVPHTWCMLASAELRFRGASGCTALAPTRSMISWLLAFKGMC